MRTTTLLSITVACLVASGCASQNPPSTTSASGPVSATPLSDEYGPVKKVKSRDGSYEGEIVGTVVPNGKFSKLQIGMSMPEVLALVGGPDGMSTHETGKRWIPFYFGGDARRVEVFYKGEGCLTYTGGNAWGGGDNQLIRITGTLRTDCTD